ncbi:unnamed protein product [Thlaspi arvense]|uniref:Uncharacterized protein n=1 Tax=Thlaspi arvense TaxID=13288 RepID=A0AAU9RVU6_THLAR|nr:unnamed protein product [Thlaspi arvense]
MASPSHPNSTPRLASRRQLHASTTEPLTSNAKLFESSRFGCDKGVSSQAWRCSGLVLVCLLRRFSEPGEIFALVPGGGEGILWLLLGLQSVRFSLGDRLAIRVSRRFHWLGLGYIES